MTTPFEFEVTVKIFLFLYIGLFEKYSYYTTEHLFLYNSLLYEFVFAYMYQPFAYMYQPFISASLLLISFIVLHSHHL